MHFLLIGASGRTGQDTLQAALAHNHTIIALVRDASSLSTYTSNQSINIVTGTPLSAADLDKAFTVHGRPDAVINTLGVARGGSDSPFAAVTGPPDFLPNVTRLVTAAMRKHGVLRLVVMSSYGAGESWKTFPLAFKGLFSATPMGKVLAQHSAAEATLRGEDGKDVEWILIKPTVLKGEEEKPVRDMGEVGKGVSMFDGVSRASVAVELVKAAETGGKALSRVIVN